jgi:hypothetical protein
VCPRGILTSGVTLCSCGMGRLWTCRTVREERAYSSLGRQTSWAWESAPRANAQTPPAGSHRAWSRRRRLNVKALSSSPWTPRPTGVANARIPVRCQAIRFLPFRSRRRAWARVKRSRFHPLPILEEVFHGANLRSPAMQSCRAYARAIVAFAFRQRLLDFSNACTTRSRSTRSNRLPAL